MNTLTRFKEISELSPEEKNVFFDFGPLNRLVERDRYNREDIELAYLDVVLDQRGMADYGELHFHIKYLLEEAKVAINKILVYSAYKFPFFTDYFIEKIEDSDVSVLLWEDNIEKIRQKNSFSVIVVITNWNWEKTLNEFVFSVKNHVNENLSNLAMMMKLCADLINNDSYFELEVE